jgi:hypothetical protein
VPFCKYPKNNEYYYSKTDDPDSSESDSSKLRKKVKKLKRTVDWIGNYVEEQTGIEPGKELDSSDSDYAPPEKKVKPRRNPVRAVQQLVQSNDHQLGRIIFPIERYSSL